MHPEMIRGIIGFLVGMNWPLSTDGVEEYFWTERAVRRAVCMPPPTLLGDVSQKAARQKDADTGAKSGSVCRTH